MLRCSTTYLLPLLFCLTGCWDRGEAVIPAGSTDADGGSAADAAGAEGPFPWTVLVYMISDNNLERNGIDDLVEMSKANASRNLRFVAQIDRAMGFYELGVGSLSDFTSTKRLLIQNGEVMEVQDLGEENELALPPLSSFIEWAAQSYPSEKYILVLWDHGMGWQGFGEDKSVDPPGAMSLADLNRSLREGMRRANIPQFELVGFDACLMGDLAALRMLAGVSPFVIASQDFEPTHGWNYTVFSGLEADPSMAIEELGKSILSGFRDQASEQGKTQSITLALYDMAHLAELDAAFEAFNALLDGDPAGLVTPLARARSEAQAFGRSSDPHADFQMVDLGDLSERLAELEPRARASADAIASALEQLVVAKEKGALTRAATGVSIYFPSEPDLYLSKFDEAEPLSRWRDVLGRLFLEADSLTEPELGCSGCLVTDGADAVATAECDRGRVKTLASLTSPMNSSFAKAALLAGFLDDRGQPTVLRRLPVTVEANGRVTGVWDQKVLVAIQGSRAIPVFSKSLEEGGLAYHEVPLLYTLPGACPCVLPGDPGFADTDGDGLGNCIDTDVDGDDVPDSESATTDNCPFVPNLFQLDRDGDGTGDDCESRSNVPELACVPLADAPLFGRGYDVTLQVVTDQLRGTTIATSFYRWGEGGVSEWRPKPGTVLHPKILVLDANGDWKWVVGGPLPVQPSRELQFIFAPIDHTIITDLRGLPVLEVDGSTRTLEEALDFRDSFTELQVANAAGRGDRVHWAGDERLLGGGCPAPEPGHGLCPATQLVDCAGTCVDLTSGSDDVCDDGSNGLPDLYCERFELDQSGGCLPPPCPGPLGFVRDCHGKCLATASRIGDGTCDSGASAREPDFACARLEYDGGDCAVQALCGDGRCDRPSESCGACPLDCGACPVGCGNGVCQRGLLENCFTCGADCGPCVCGDAVCVPGAESCESCARDCGTCPLCGDEECSLFTSSAPYPLSRAESCLTCATDCGACGDSCCEPHEQRGGCADTRVASCVCALDPTCCSFGWSASCVALAKSSCGLAGCCVPDCLDAACGADGCGGLCGACAADQLCASERVCVPRTEHCNNGRDDDRDGQVDCADGECRASAQCFGGSCSSPERIACGALVESDTTGLPSNIDRYDGACGGRAASRGEDVYVFTLARTTSVTFDLSPHGADLDLGLLDGTCDGARCVAESVTSGPEQLSFLAQAGVSYFVIVDSESGEGSYSLGFGCAP
ncbi:MAG: hypothetical protein HYV07_17555 [Deltaproteobacteria bacterium]|nr:hypothetical protein [Deltaproteobacteria bacterium]